MEELGYIGTGHKTDTNGNATSIGRMPNDINFFPTRQKRQNFKLSTSSAKQELSNSPPLAPVNWAADIGTKVVGLVAVHKSELDN